MGLLRVKNLSKDFFGNLALDKIDFDLREGEIHGLVGANGSGKSTFMNILNGEVDISATGGYSGKIFIEGKPVTISGVKDSLDQGIYMVHQELTILNSLKVYENINLNNEKLHTKTKFLGDYSIIDIEANKKVSNESLYKLGVNIDTRKITSDLSSTEKQFIEIARAIKSEDLKVLILDEPTSSLNIAETEKLLEHLKILKDSGISIIFISHRLEEVEKICDRVSVLRNGKMIKTYEKEDFDLSQIALDMVGEKVVKVKSDYKEDLDERDYILEFENYSFKKSLKNYKSFNIGIKDGEILGITGLAGQGYDILAQILCHKIRADGTIKYKGRVIDRKKLDEHIYIVAEDRKNLSLLLNSSIWKNITFESYDRHKKFLKHPRLSFMSTLNMDSIYSYSESIAEELNIKYENLNQKVKELSGGNQQKVCIARAKTVDRDILLIGEPTRGIDIYSKEIILDVLIKMNSKENKTIVIYSGETDELMRVADRIAVVNDYEVMKIFNRDQYNSLDFRLAISGRVGGSSD